MKHRILMLVVAAVIIASLVLVGCASEEAPSAPAAPTPAAPTPAAPAAPAVTDAIKLVVASHMTPKYQDSFLTMSAFIDDVNEVGQGKVELDFYHSGTLLKVKELIPGLEAGAVDIIFLTTSHCTGSWPIIGCEALPFLCKTDYDLERLFKMESPTYNFINEVMVEKHGIMFLANGLLPLEYIWTNKPVEKPSDIKGLKLRVGGEIEGKTVQTLGGSPVFMPSAELYEAFQRGTVDGAICYAGTIGGRSLQDVVKYCTKVPIGAYGYSLWIKKDTWDSLPQDVRDIIYMAIVKYDYFFLDRAKAVHGEEYWPLFLEAGMEVIEPSPEVVSEFRTKCKPVWDEWAKEIGPDGAKFLELATK